jgi:protocatechuate 3,4-dioxygenase beta subunit
MRHQISYNEDMKEKKPDIVKEQTPGNNIKYTPEVEEGPYYKAGSPEKKILFEPGVPGERLTLSGHVYDINLKPLLHAWLDFWQADGNGRYDNSGYVLRGHQYTNDSGQYTIDTVVPGSYPGRTPHIHVKVRANDRSPILTLQLFIPGIASNEGDFLYQKALLIKMEAATQGKKATFDFVVKS